MSDTLEVTILRAMEWERAKGAINAVMVSFVTMGESRFERLKELKNKFEAEFGDMSGID